MKLYEYEAIYEIYEYETIWNHMNVLIVRFFNDENPPPSICDLMYVLYLWLILYLYLLYQYHLYVPVSVSLSEFLNTPFTHQKSHHHHHDLHTFLQLSMAGA